MEESNKKDLETPVIEKDNAGKHEQEEGKFNFYYYYFLLSNYRNNKRNFR